MRNGVQTTRDANDPGALYIYCMYHEFWYGPFADESAVVAALRQLDEAEPMWDYDCFSIHYGVANMKDAMRDPVYVTRTVRDRILVARRAVIQAQIGD